MNKFLEKIAATYNVKPHSNDNHDVKTMGLSEHEYGQLQDSKKKNFSGARLGSGLASGAAVGGLLGSVMHKGTGLHGKRGLIGAGLGAAFAAHDYGKELHDKSLETAGLSKYKTEH